MAVFICMFTHPDYDSWLAYQADHLDYLRTLQQEGTLLAAGPPERGGDTREGLVICEAKDEPAARAIVARDPYAIHDNLEDLQVIPWDPIFGPLQEHSTFAGLDYAPMRTKILDASQTTASGPRA